MRTFWALLVLVGLVASPAFAADATKPHPHQGVLAPYKGAPPMLELTNDDLAQLARGQTVRKQTKDEDGTGGRGIAVQDVHATPEVIWSRIIDFPKYPDWVDGVHECEVYAKHDDHIKVRFIIGAIGVKVEYFIDHVYHPDQGWMTWTLDYSRESDLDDSVGFWRVVPLPDKPGWSRVFYSVDVKLRGWVPGFIQSMLTRRGLTQATEWVKRESEKAAAAAG